MTVIQGSSYILSEKCTKCRKKEKIMNETEEKGSDKKIKLGHVHLCSKKGQSSAAVLVFIKASNMSEKAGR